MIYVKDIMTRDVKTIHPKTSIKKAAEVMERYRIGSLVVIDKGRPVGIVTEGDISRAVARGIELAKHPVKEIMSGSLITINPEARVEEAARIMAERKVKKLPVVENDKLVGIVTQTDIVATTFDLVTALKEMVWARYRPPEFQL
jgi:CBS domain-containing protein